MNSDLSALVFRTRGLYMFIALMVSVALKSWSHGTTSAPLFIAGVVIIVVAQTFRTYSASYLWGRQAVREVEADFLCISGPYAYLRNPLYLGNLLIGLGLCIAINEWYAYVLFVISYAFVYSIVIPYEERFLQEKFGDAYLEYKAATRSLLPKLIGYKSHTKVIPNFKAGVLGEIYVPIVLAIVLMIVYSLFVR